MKLFRVRNGYQANGDVHVLVITESYERARALASDAFKADADRLPIDYKPSYWEPSGLTSEILCEDVTQEWVGRVED